ncbi:hypothetical protein HHI36_000558 [Cryptolaemus montrouzieri]|uniref:Uncharacterized protein n=1 Tax=Cryptolaemus montrouzieri TaxID=559131 RepID=A0ABD2P537_9CUCU
MNVMKVKIDVVAENIEFYNLGKPDQSKSTMRPILMELSKWNKKLEILKAAIILKGTKIYIKEDYPKSFLKQKKMVFKYMIEARKAGDIKHMKYDSLAINGEIFTLEQLEKNNENKEEKEGNTETTIKERTLSERSPSNEIEDGRPMKITRGENSKN